MIDQHADGDAGSARAASGQAAVPPSAAMNSRSFMPASNTWRDDHTGWNLLGGRHESALSRMAQTSTSQLAMHRLASSQPFSSH